MLSKLKERFAKGKGGQVTPVSQSDNVVTLNPTVLETSVAPQSASARPRAILEAFQSLRHMSMFGLLLALLPVKFLSPYVILLAKLPVLAPIAIMGVVSLGTIDSTNITEMVTQNAGAVATVGGWILLVLFAQNWYRFSMLVHSVRQKEWTWAVKQVFALLTPLASLSIWNLEIPFAGVTVFQFYLVTITKAFALPFLMATGGAALVSSIMTAEGTLDYVTFAKANVFVTLVLLLLHASIFLWTYNKVYKGTCAAFDWIMGQYRNWCESFLSMTKRTGDWLTVESLKTWLRLPIATVMWLLFMAGWIAVTWVAPSLYFGQKLAAVPGDALSFAVVLLMARAVCSVICWGIRNDDKSTWFGFRFKSWLRVVEYEVKTSSVFRNKTGLARTK